MSEMGKVFSKGVFSKGVLIFVLDLLCSQQLGAGRRGPAATEQIFSIPYQVRFYTIYISIY